MDDQKKKSFAEILANTGAAKHNSDLQNLANAKLAIKGHMKDLAKMNAQHPLVNQLLQAMDDHPTLTRNTAMVRAGYTKWYHAKMASGAYSPRLIAFIDICNAVGLDVVLVPMEKTTIENKKPIAQPN